jgi:anti-anti-sigma regulatory factor
MSELESLTVDNAQAAKRALAALLSSGKAAVVDMATISDIDLAGLQLLFAAFQQARAERRELTLTGPLSESARAAIALSGLADESCADGEELTRVIKAVL